MKNIYILKSKNSFRIGNRFIEREIFIKKGILSTISLKNKLTEKEFQLNSSEFVLRINNSTILTTKDFLIKDSKIGKLSKNGQQLHIKLFNKKHSISIELLYHVMPNEFYLKKYLIVNSTDCLINEIGVEKFKIKASAFRFGGFGQPIFIDDQLFLGLEYPAGYNLFNKDKIVTLIHYPGKKGKVVSKTAVIGVCPDTVNNRIKEWFFKYIELNRARPVKRFFNCYLPPFWDNQSIMNCKDLNKCKDIKYWKLDQAQKIYYENNIPVNTIYIKGSQAWFEPQSVMGEKSQVKQLIPLNFIQKEVKEKINAGMGFHLNTGGGRSSTDHKWLADNFDMIDDRYYCLADPKAKEELKKNLLHLVKKYNANWFHFDWLWWKTAWQCPKKNHRGHIPGIKYSREAITDSFIEISQALRKADRNIYLGDLEVELSPWWLFYVDSLWDYVGEGPTTTNEIIDGSLKMWTKKNTVFPFSGLLHAWNYLPKIAPKSKRKPFNDKICLEDVLMDYLRGGQFHFIWQPHFLGSIKNFSSKYTDSLVKVVKWATSKEEILLANTTPVLGSAPTKKDRTYGYSHFLENNHGIIGLRNPVLWEKEQIKLKLDEKIHFYKGEVKHVVKVIFPYEEILPGLYNYGDILELEIQGGQLLILEIIPLEEIKELLISGCCYQEEKKNKNRVLYQLYNIPGKKIPISLLPSKETRRMWLDEREIDSLNFDLPIKKATSFFKLEDSSLESSKDCAFSLKGAFRVNIPSKEKVSLWIGIDLYENDSKREKHEGKEEDTKNTYAEQLSSFEEAADKICFQVKNNRKIQGPVRLQSLNQKLIKIARHPQKTSLKFIRVLYVNELLTGEVDFSLETSYHSVKAYAWLEREIPLVAGSKIMAEASCHLYENKLPFFAKKIKTYALGSCSNFKEKNC